MNEYEIALKIIAVIVFITVTVLMRIIFYYKNKYHDAFYELNFEKEKLIAYEELLDELEEKLKEPEKIFRIEKVVMTP